MNNEVINVDENSKRRRQEKIYLDFKDKVYTMCILHTNNVDDAEDLTQEIFLKIFKGLRKFKEGNLGGWVYRITINHILNSIYRRRNFLEYKESYVPSKKYNIEADLEIKQSLQKLPEKLSLLLILKVKEGLSYRELSEVFGVPIGTIGSRLAKARLLFKKYYGGKND